MIPPSSGEPLPITISGRLFPASSLEFTFTLTVLIGFVAAITSTGKNPANKTTVRANAMILFICSALSRKSFLTSCYFCTVSILSRQTALARSSPAASCQKNAVIGNNATLRSYPT